MATTTTITKTTKVQENAQGKVYTGYSTQTAKTLAVQAFNYFGTEKIESALKYSVLEYRYMEYICPDTTTFEENAIIALTFQAIRHIDALLRRGVTKHINASTDSYALLKDAEKVGLVHENADHIFDDDPQRTRAAYVCESQKVVRPGENGLDALAQIVVMAAELWKTGRIKHSDTFHDKTIEYQSIAQPWLLFVNAEYKRTHPSLSSGISIHETTEDGEQKIDISENTNYTSQFVKEEYEDRAKAARTRLLALAQAYGISTKALHDCIDSSGELNMRKIQALKGFMSRQSPKVRLQEDLHDQKHDLSTVLKKAEKSRQFVPAQDFTKITEKSDFSYYTESAREAIKRDKQRKAANSKALAEKIAREKAGETVSYTPQEKRELGRRRRKALQLQAL